MRLVAALFLLIGLALLWIAAWSNEREKDFYATALHANGAVVDMIARRSGKSGITWAPQVQFTDNAGRVTGFVSKMSSKPPSHHTGETVRVVYSPSNSERAEIDSFFAHWGLVIISGGMRALFPLIGVGTLIAGRSRVSP